MCVLSGLAACSDRGDLGRSSPSLISKTYMGGLNKARQWLGEEEDYDLPLTAAEDALRKRARDMETIRYVSVATRVAKTYTGDGYSHVSTLTQELHVDRQRFIDFIAAARKVMQIDEARNRRLKGLDALTARRQMSISLKRRGLNDRLIRNGVRTMRARARAYKKLLRQLPVEWPQVPLAELQDVYEDFHEDVVRFHGEIDQRAHNRLEHLKGQKLSSAYKK
ncbi:MAG: hypothetical protein L3J67_01580 [Hyphomicrobiaceae bacterium]|nr:hypothetical protein [Hyphomicrobiaceae bacterium]